MRIAIVGAPVGAGSTFGVNTAYVRFAEMTAFQIEEDHDPQISVISPRSKAVQDVDLLILPGGADVLDESTKPGYYTQKPNLFYEYFDRNVMPLYIEKNIPIFGICRGFQSINIRFTTVVMPLGC